MKKIYLCFLLISGLFASAQNPASIDPTFYSTTPADAIVSASNGIPLLHQLPDGKMLIGCNYYNNIYYPGIARINADGSRDTSFFIGSGNAMKVISMDVQSDGKIIIGGDFTNYLGEFGGQYNRIGRYNINGGRDNSFQIGTGFNEVVRKLIVMPDDKILVFGDFTTYQGQTATRMIRLNADGTKDETFTIGTGFNDVVYDAIVQPDGKILVAGRFSSVQGHVTDLIARLNANGTVDTSFSIDAMLGEDGVTSIALQPDQKILVRGDFSLLGGSLKNGIARLHPDGSNDDSFQSGIGVVTQDLIPIIGGRISMTPDGKILVATLSYKGIPYGGLVRLNLDGNVDATFNAGRASHPRTEYMDDNTGGYYMNWVFNTNGKITVAHDSYRFDDYYARNVVQLNDNGSVNHAFNMNKGFKGDVYTSVRQPDGKIVVGGVLNSYNSHASSRLIRLNANGTPDFGFNLGTGFNYAVKTLALQPDGKLIVGGDFTQYNGTNCLGLVRLNPDGTRDTGFNVNVPLSGTYAGNPVTIESVAVQTDGKILVGGYFQYSFQQVLRKTLMRLNANGTFDSTFLVSASYNAPEPHITFQPDGKILISGYGVSGVIRLNPDASQDATFALVGTGFTNASGAAAVKQMVLQPDGKIVVSGSFTKYNSVTTGPLTRLNNDGTRDMTFMGGVPDFASGVTHLNIQPDGKILVSGELFQYSGQNVPDLIRINPNGTRDTGFTLSLDFPCTTSHVLADGKILIGGDFFKYYQTPVNHFTRLNGDGTHDTTFNNDSGYDDIVNTIATTNDNKIVTGGNYTNYNGTDAKQASRLLSNGNIDTTFNTSGTGFNASLRNVAAQTDAKVIAAGEFTSYNGVNLGRIARLNANGSVDATFNTGTGFNNTVHAVAVQADGKVVAVGEFTTYNGIATNRIARLNSDGSLDATFALGGGLNGTAHAILLQTDGKIVIGGSFTAYNGNTANGIARLSATAVFDGSLTIGAGFNQAVKTLALQSDGKILAGGDFTTFNGIAANRIVRLSANGTSDAGFVSGNGFAAAVHCLAIQEDGKILVGGDFDNYNGTAAQKLTCLLPSGVIDTAFDTSTGFNGVVNALKIQNGGAILVGGDFTSYKSQNVNRLTRLEGTAVALSTPGFEKKQSSLVIYPNPVSDILNFETKTGQVIGYEIYDLNGKIVDRRPLQQQSVNVFHLPNGIYIILARTDHGTFSKKFIKQ